MRLFLFAALALFVSGCGSLDDIYRQNDRYGHRTADSRASNEVRRDVGRYVREVDRAVRLDRRQERQIFELLEDRAYRAATRGRADRNRRDAYPFPRSARPSREAERFWRDADRRIERVLDRRQRDRYRDFTDRFERRDRRDRRDRRGRRGRN